MCRWQPAAITLALLCAGCGGNKPAGTCAAEPLPLDVELPGDSSARSSSADTSCGQSLGQPDAVYRVEHGEGLLSVTIAPSGWDAVLELGDGCESARLAREARESGPGRCVDGAYADGAETLSACVVPGASLVLVDGFGDPEEAGLAAGPFTIGASLEACPDGAACFPGVGCAVDLAPGDGCDAAVDLPLGATVVGDTAGMSDDLSGFGCDPLEVDAAPFAIPDGVFAIDAPAAGMLSFDVRSPSADGPVRLLAALRPGCDASEGETCGAFGSGRTCVDRGRYSLVIDGLGAFAATASFAPCAEGETCQHGSCLPPLTPEVEPNDDAETAQSVDDGTFIEARLGPDDVDLYRVILANGQTLRFSAERGCEADTVMSLYAEPLAEPAPAASSCADADPGRLLCSDDGESGACGSGSFTASAAGAYLLRVVEWAFGAGDGAAGDGYVIEVRIR